MKIETLEVAGFLPALKGMRNPKNSWDKGDTVEYADSIVFKNEYVTNVDIGDADMKLAKTLIKGGKEHAKFLRQIMVWADIDMPRYWWSEFDTYKIGTTANSCSTMHKLMTTDISYSDFEFDGEDSDIISSILYRLRYMQMLYKDAETQQQKDMLLKRAKSILPEGFLQLRTVNINYQQLMNIYHQRKNHRLKKEWVDTFCRWCESLPYFKELCIDTVE